MKRIKRPVARYYGGKWKLADWIIASFPSHDLVRTYIEGYSGAASVLIKKKPHPVEVYNDLSGEMVNLFRVLRSDKDSKRLIHLLSLTPWARDEWEAAYEISNDPVEQARRTIVLCTMSHNPSKSLNRLSNGFRVSTKSDHRLPQDFCRYAENIPAITNRLKKVIIENRSAKEICQKNDSEMTLHYLDPPYMGSLRSTNKGDYYQHEMRGSETHEDMLEWASALQGYVVISSYDSELYNDVLLLNGWERKSTQAVTGAAKKGGRHATEVLYLNPKTIASNRQLKMFVL